jgi:hypothetical protein
LAIMAGAIDRVLAFQQDEAVSETIEEGKKAVHRCYADAVVALSKAFALAAATDANEEDPDRGSPLSPPGRLVFAVRKPVAQDIPAIDFLSVSAAVLVYASVRLFVYSQMHSLKTA